MLHRLVVFLQLIIGYGRISLSVHPQKRRFGRLRFPLLMNPFALKPDYAPELSEEELYLMGVEDSHDLCYYVLCAVREPVGESTVNLKCPVVVNDRLKRAVQVILESDSYHMRHRLAEFRSEEAGPKC